MKILNAAQIRELDHATLLAQNLRSSELMERAANACLKRLSKLIHKDEWIDVFCGSGNNGGDGFAIARLLLDQDYHVRVISPNYNASFSPDAELNLKRLKQIYPGVITEIKSLEELLALHLESHHFAIDCLLGTGLNKPVEGFLGEVIDFINTKYKSIISIDVPSGLFSDQSSDKNKHIIHCHLCLSFQLPKLAFLLPQNGKYVQEFEILDIGLDVDALSRQSSHLYYISMADIHSLLKPRAKFSHKGQFGHALLVAGSKGKSGAALIAAKACLRSGAGRLTTHGVSETTQALLHFLPEAMSETDPDPNNITEIDHLDSFDALCFGPGLGTAPDTALVLKKILNYFAGPLLIDADGLNILSQNKTWLSFMPANAILTPHPKEFERLAEKHTDDFDRLACIRNFSMKNNCILIYKGAHSIVAMPDGNLFFNSSGNAGLAKGGSGDALSGIILGLLARGYSEAQAALIGTFMHGFAADLCVQTMSKESMLITDVINCLPEAFLRLEK